MAPKQRARAALSGSETADQPQWISVQTTWISRRRTRRRSDSRPCASPALWRQRYDAVALVSQSNALLSRAHHDQRSPLLARGLPAGVGARSSVFGELNLKRTLGPFQKRTAGTADRARGVPANYRRIQ